MLLTGGGDEQLSAIKYHLIPYTRGKHGIELGRGPFKAFPQFLGIREKDDPTLDGVKPDLEIESFAKLRDSIKDDSLDFVFAWGDVAIDAQIVASVLRNGGYFIDCTRPAHIVSRKDDDELSPVAELEVDAALVGRKPTACIVRYGAIGDQLQSAALLHALAEEGYHITWMCEPTGELVMRHDPRIDRFYFQNKDQVPNDELMAYWAVQRTKYDKWINLCETVEGTLLAMPGRMLYEFSHEARHAVCDHNYLEFQAKVAELPFRPEHRFYASDEEEARSKRFIARIAEGMNPGWGIGQRWIKPYVVMFALAGSSVHKTYPHMDAVVDWILVEIPNAHVVFVGDDACRLLECNYTEHERVTCASGEMDLRDTLTLARHCDLVIGPETGVLNCVAFEANAKIVLLSHSSHENLTKHWNNTDALHASGVPCYPCHQLHSTFDKCWEHEESGTAMCQWKLGPEGVIAAVKRAYTATGTVRRLLEAA